MSMTDPIADMLTRLRNGNAAYHDEIIMPSSRMKVEIAKVLKQEGYIRDFAVSKEDVGSKLTIVLKYGPNRERTISGVRRISKPGLRVYAKKENLPRVLGGLGIAIVSTPQGVMTAAEAKRANVGGEIICYVW